MWTLLLLAVAAQAQVAAGWPEPAGSLVAAMRQKYGEPTRVSDDAVLWIGNGPWRKTIVYRTPPAQDSAHPGPCLIAQTVSYEVPRAKVGELRSFDRLLDYDGVYRELTSCAASEALNFLSLNLADEVVRERRTPAEARAFSAKTARLAESGRSSHYLDRFLFRLPLD